MRRQAGAELFIPAMKLVRKLGTEGHVASEDVHTSFAPSRISTWSGLLGALTAFVGLADQVGHLGAGHGVVAAGGRAVTGRASDRRVERLEPRVVAVDAGVVPVAQELAGQSAKEPQPEPWES